MELRGGRGKSSVYLCDLMPYEKDSSNKSLIFGVGWPSGMLGMRSNNKVILIGFIAWLVFKDELTLRWLG